MPIVLQVTSMAYGGEGVGRWEGKAVFVPYAMPGDEVTAEIVEDRGRYARARLVQITAPSAERVTPPSPHFGPDSCGGCNWQQVSYGAQLAFKAGIVRDQLTRLGRLADPLVRAPLGMDDPWGYRNHLQLVVQAGWQLGYQAAGSHRTVVVTQCPIAHPLVASMVSVPVAGEAWRLPSGLGGAWVRRAAPRAGVNTGQRLLVLETYNQPPHVRGVWPFAVAAEAGTRVVSLAGRAHLEERLGGRVFRYSPRSFFQVNTTQAERLVDLVARYVNPQGDETLLDCFCGVGVFGLLLASRVRRVIGVEESGSAIADARINAKGVANVTFLHGQAQSVLPSLGEPVHAVVLDPPREGCDPAMLKALVGLMPRRIAYVSCDPSTLARDVARLGEAGYALREATPVDMFPQTYHVETVCLLERKSGLE
jgi:23S rRNA (uracil1939-C5)-methyltransferase